MINSRSPKATYLPLLFIGIAAALFSSVALTAAPIAGWFRSSFQVSEPAEASGTLAEDPAGAGQARSSGAKCAECGVIESMRRLAPVGNAPAVYEIIVRMRDGSARVNSQASPAMWRTGERIMLLGGENLPVR